QGKEGPMPGQDRRTRPAGRAARLAAVLISALPAGCPRPAPPGSAPVPGPETARGPTPGPALVAARSASRAIDDVACDTESEPRCWLLIDGRLHTLDPVTLEPSVEALVEGL